MKNRRIPILKVNLNPRINYSELGKIPEIKNIVLNETIYAIKDGINKKKNSIFIFEIANSDLLIELKKDDWESTLKNSLEYFIEIEDYNKCIEIRDLIEKL